MEIIQDRAVPHDIVLTIGKYESIHLGHQSIIREVVELAKSRKIASAVMIFDPHPAVFFDELEYVPLFSKDELMHIFEGLGVDYLIIQPFDHDFASMKPDDFCKKIFNDFRAKIVVVGEGYRFGHKRAGTVSLLQEYGEVKVIHQHGIDNYSKISTSHIRRLLSGGKLTEASLLLGFPFFIMGTTRRGQQLGRSIGFPTLNIYPSEKCKFLLADGVYATLTVIDGKSYPGITNIGLRPTVSSDNKTRSVETHLFNFPKMESVQEFYGRQIKTEFLRFIRPEKKFASLDELKAQIAKDMEDF